MRLDDSRESENVEDRRGMGMRASAAARLGIGAIILALVAMYFGVDPSVVPQVLQESRRARRRRHKPPATAPPANDPQRRFVAKVLGETEDTWQAIFRDHAKRPYVPPKLVLYTGATITTACGTGRAAMGAVLLPGRQQGVSGPELLRRHEAPLPGARRFRAGLCHRA